MPNHADACAQTTVHEPSTEVAFLPQRKNRSHVLTSVPKPHDRHPGCPCHKITRDARFDRKARPDGKNKIVTSFIHKIVIQLSLRPCNKLICLGWLGWAFDVAKQSWASQGCQWLGKIEADFMRWSSRWCRETQARAQMCRQGRKRLEGSWCRTKLGRFWGTQAAT